MASVVLARSAVSFSLVLFGFASLAAAPNGRDGALAFEANRGQTDAAAAFLARADGYQALVSASGVTLRLPDAVPARENRLELVFLDAAPADVLSGAGEGAERVHYLAGDDAGAWIRDVPTFAGVTRSDLYPGVALGFHGDGRRLVIELVLAAGADPAAIRLGLRGARTTRIDGATGTLVALVGDGEIRFALEDAAASFVNRGHDEVGLVPRDANSDAPLTLRMSVSAPTAARPPAREVAARVATDAEGNAYVAGRLQTYPGDRAGAFVAKVARDGRTRLYTTYFGASSDDVPLGIAVGGAAEAIVVGRAFPRGPRGDIDAFIVKLDADGSAVSFSRVYGGEGDDEALAVALDASGAAWVVGRSTSPRAEARLARFDVAGSRLDAGTGLASLDAAAATAIAVDSEHAVYVAGSARNGEPFLAKLEAPASVLWYAGPRDTATGGTVTDLALDRSGVLRVAGRSPSGPFALTLAAADGALLRDVRSPGASGEAAGLALDGTGGAWIAGGEAAALHVDRAGRVIERIAGLEKGAGFVVTGIAPAGDGGAFLAGTARDAATSGLLMLGSSPTGRTVVVGIVPALPPGPDAADCPGTIQFTNGGGTGLWQTPSNWNLGHVPLSTDDVCIPAGFSVTLSSVAQSVDSVYVAATSSLTVSASLSSAAASQIDGSLTLQTGGSLTGSGDITCANTFNWVAGSITGAAGFFADGGISVSGASAHDLTSSRALVVSGTTTWTGTGGIRIGSSASITNHGTWDCQTNASISNLGSAGGFTNVAGATFKKSVATGTTTVAVPFANAGTTSVVSGTLNLSGGGTHAGGFTGSGGTTLQFGGGTHTLSGGSSINASTVVFDAGTVHVGGTYAVTTATTVSGATANFDLAGTVTGVGSALTISSGTANFGSGEPIAPAALTVSGGTLQGSDTVTVSGLLTWTAGTMTGPATTFANGGVAFSGAAARDLTGARVLRTAGTTTWTGTGPVRIGTAATITNDGTWDCQSDATMANLGSAGAFTNAAGATFKKSGGTGSSVVAIPFTNTGGTVILSGTLNLSGGGTHAGSFTGSPSTTLTFGGGTHALGAGSSLAAASVVFDAGTVHVDGAYAATTGTTVSGATAHFNPSATVSSIGSLLAISGGTANFSSGGPINTTTLAFSGGTLQGSDIVTLSGLTTWTAGTMTGAATTHANGGVTFTGAAARDLTGSRVLHTSGATTWTGTGPVRIGTAATITNDGTWDCQSDGTIASLGSAGAFTNTAGAIFKKSAGAGTTTVAVPIAGSGAISVLAGTLSLTGGGTYSGPLTGAPGTVLRFGGGTHTLDAGSTIAAATVVLDAGTVHIDAPYAATAGTTISGAVANFNPAATLTSVGSALTVSGGTANFSSGEAVAASTMSFSSGTIQGTDAITISGLTFWTGGTMTGSGTTYANGGIDFSGAAARDLTGGRTLSTGGTTTWTGSGPIRLGSAASIANAGTWDCQGSASIADLGASGPFTNGAAGIFKKSAGATTTVMLPFANLGEVHALAATLQFMGDYTQSSGSTVLSGGSIASTAPLDIQAGTFTGTGSTLASVVSAGHAVPGLSIGVLTLSGNYTQSPAGSLDVQLGGRIAGTEYDQLNLIGPGVASFAGSLNVSLADGFVPVGGDSFTLMSYASSTGVFSASSLPPLAQGCWRTFYNPTSLELQVWTVAPETNGVAVAANKSTVSWNPLPPAAGPSPTYDLMRGSLAQFPVGGKPAETCVASGVATTSASDAASPDAGSGFYYLVRGANACGAGGYGSRSNGTPRTPTVCP